MVYVRWMLAITLCALLMAAPALTSHAAGGKGAEKSPSSDSDLRKKKASAAAAGRLKHSGKQKRNRRIKIAARPHMEVVKGTISGLDRDGIYMDGEYFRIGYSEIKTPSGLKLKVKDLFYGLKASVVYSYGTIEKTIVTGLVNRPRLTSEKALKERREMTRAARTRNMLNKGGSIEAIEGLEMPSAEEPERR